MSNEKKTPVTATDILACINFKRKLIVVEKNYKHDISSDKHKKCINQMF